MWRCPGDHRGGKLLHMAAEGQMAGGPRGASPQATGSYTPYWGLLDTHEADKSP